MTTDTRNTLLRNSALSTDAIQVGSDTVGQVGELGNLDGDAARARKQANADFAPMQSRRSTVYTFGIVLKSNSSIAAVAVAYGDYHSGESHLYAEAALRSPGNREIVAKSPASSFRTYAAAAAPLEIGTEDGAYQGGFTFGEFCGYEDTPRLYTER